MIHQVSRHDIMNYICFKCSGVGIDDFWLQLQAQLGAIDMCVNREVITPTASIAVIMKIPFKLTVINRILAGRSVMFLPKRSEIWFISGFCSMNARSFFDSSTSRMNAESSVRYMVYSQLEVANMLLSKSRKLDFCLRMWWYFNSFSDCMGSCNPRRDSQKSYVFP